MQHSLIRLLILFFCWLPVSSLAATQTIRVEWGYTPPTSPALTGYKLYQEGTFACQSKDPKAATMDCQVSLIKDSTNFTLTAVFSDGTESPHSAPFPFTTSSGGSTPPNTTNPPASGTDSKLFTFSWQSATNTTALKGYRVYLNNALLCETTNTAATSLGCQADLIQGIMNFSMTQVATNGTESAPSNILTYSGDSSTTAGTTDLKAIITAKTTSSPASLSVGFDAGTSTGGIASYLWDFGDGATATTKTATHIYTASGTYTAKLTITDGSGKTNTSLFVINASSVGNPTGPATSPTAVISSSAATGQAPLAVNFDGSGSKAVNASVVSHAWDFGDGSSAKTASTSHSYSSVGTFTTTLTVTDSNGLSSQTTTPVIVTAPPVTTNKAPQAVISATATSGSTPLTVSFNGGGSTDSDGSISTYVWNFGDGSSATGKTATHTYTSEASFAATLQVTDNLGVKASANVTITVQAKETSGELNFETGEVGISSNWVRVPLTGTYNNPVVIAGPPSFKNSEPCVVLLRNIDKTGFEIKLLEWNYLDRVHPQETISYLVMEKGRHTLPDGSLVEAGTFTGTTTFTTVPFSAAMAKTPIVLTTVASANEGDTISGRITNITASGFNYSFREQEKNTNSHVNEAVNFIAWEPGKGAIGSVQFEVGRTANAVTSSWYTGSFTSAFKQAPLVLADMQTTNNTDTSALRAQQITATGFQVKVEEEQSLDSEVTHPAETVGYIALNQPQEKVLASFAWDFDSAKEATIIGFQILANGEQICASNAPSARQVNCEINKPSGPTAFTIQAVEKTGGNSMPSNSITYTP